MALALAKLPSQLKPKIVVKAKVLGYCPRWPDLNMPSAIKAKEEAVDEYVFKNYNQKFVPENAAFQFYTTS